jgi:hypothetical protein
MSDGAAMPSAIFTANRRGEVVFVATAIMLAVSSYFRAGRETDLAQPNLFALLAGALTIVTVVFIFRMLAGARFVKVTPEGIWWGRGHKGRLIPWSSIESISVKPGTNWLTVSCTEAYAPGGATVHIEGDLGVPLDKVFQTVNDWRAKYSHAA